jgi:hypothetical protein
VGRTPRCTAGLAPACSGTAGSSSCTPPLSLRSLLARRMCSPAQATGALHTTATLQRSPSLTAHQPLMPLCTFVFTSTKSFTRDPRLTCPPQRPAYAASSNPPPPPPSSSGKASAHAPRPTSTPRPGPPPAASRTFSNSPRTCSQAPSCAPTRLPLPPTAQAA